MKPFDEKNKAAPVTRKNRVINFIWKIDAVFQGRKIIIKTR